MDARSEREAHCHCKPPHQLQRRREKEKMLYPEVELPIDSIPTPAFFNNLWVSSLLTPRKQMGHFLCSAKSMPFCHFIMCGDVFKETLSPCSFGGDGRMPELCIPQPQFSLHPSLGLSLFPPNHVAGRQLVEHVGGQPDGKFSLNSFLLMVGKEGIRHGKLCCEDDSHYGPSFLLPQYPTLDVCLCVCSCVCGQGIESLIPHLLLPTHRP